MEASLSIAFEWDIERDRVRRLQSTEKALPTTGEAADTFEDVVRVVHPDDRQRFRENVQRALTEASRVYRSEHRVVRPSGEVRWHSRDDAKGRFDAYRRNYQFFDAPHVAFVCMDGSFGVGVALAVGMYIQTLMLLLWSRGIGSCAQAALRPYEDVTREELGIPAEEHILCGLSFGYEDFDDRRTPRVKSASCWNRTSASSIDRCSTRSVDVDAVVAEGPVLASALDAYVVCAGGSARHRGIAHLRRRSMCDGSSAPKLHRHDVGRTLDSFGRARTQAFFTQDLHVPSGWTGPLMTPHPPHWPSAAAL